MTAQIDPLQLKIQTQLLQAMFMKNMGFLQQSMPAIFDFYQSYQPQTTQLAIDKQGAVNLLTNNQFLYQDDPKVASIKQVEAFIKKPVYYDYSIIKSRPYQTLYEHQRVNNQIVEERENKAGKYLGYSLNDGDQINTIAFIGCGLGYHIEHFLKRYKVRNLIIFEPSPDVFFSMLHSVDISEWYQHCIDLGGRLTFKIGGTEHQFINEIYQFLNNDGCFNLVQMFLYRHYLSDKTNDTLKLLNDMEHRFKSGWGFCEDEIIGLSHTLQNIEQNNTPVLLEKAKKSGISKSLPVFIIGNGPSLDDNLAYIKANQDKAIIISSGTSLKPLLDFGVTPDIHVEQERPKSIYQWVKKVGHEELLKTIPLVCLNTVYPGILSLFKNAYVMLKASDVGTLLVKGNSKHQYEELFFSNPTVTNASTAAAVAFGFKQLYLFGLDYGFVSEEEHHAKGSAYQDLKKYKLAGELKVPGNFGGEVFSTKIFDSSRGTLELLLQQNSDVKCINVSNGAAIKFAKPCRETDLPVFEKTLAKSDLIEQLLTKGFKSIESDLSLDNTVVEYLPRFKELILSLNKQLENVQNKEQLIIAFAKQFQLINQHNNDRIQLLFMRLFSGSLNYLQANILDNVSRFKDKNAQDEFIRFCITKMQSHFNYLLDDVSQHYNQPARA